MTLLLALVLATASAPSLDQALAFEQHGDDARAASTVDAVLAARPTYGLAHLEAGRLALKRDDLDRARLELEIATALIPENPRAQYLFGMLEEETAKPVQAIAALERAITLRPSYREAHRKVGALYLTLGDGSHAEAHFRAAAEEDPGDAGARLQLARALELEGRTADAGATLAQLHRDQPEAAFVTRALAQFYERTGQPRLARKLWRELDGPPKRHLRPLRPSRR